MHFTEADVVEVQTRWPRLRRRPGRNRHVAVLAGVFDFTLEPPGRPSITDSYRIRLHVSLVPTTALPEVFEDGGRIPREDDHHVYSDGGLCLGSPLRLVQVLGPTPSLMRFITQCVAPFLYAASWREQGGTGYPFEELAHGPSGLLSDYESIFALHGRDRVVAALNLLTLRKRVANKQPCPCGCGLRLGRCRFHLRLLPWRRHAARRFYELQARYIAEHISLVSPAFIGISGAKHMPRASLLTVWRPIPKLSST